MLAGNAGVASAAESLEFVAEHLAEIAMDNRYASLPLWSGCGGEESVCRGVSAGLARTRSGSLSNDGTLRAANADWSLGRNHRLQAFAFYDRFALRSGIERRPMEVSFAPVPLALPADGEFTGLRGTARDVGLGLAIEGTADWRWLPRFDWSAGALWQEVRLSDYLFDYRIAEGPDAGTSGTLDYSATYRHIAPFLGLSWPRSHGAWRIAPHLQLVMPLPRRGFAGRITGPGFDIAGSTADHGNSPFGDPSLTVGFDTTYQPWHLTVDLGSALTQSVLEPRIHEGVGRNLMLSAHYAIP